MRGFFVRIGAVIAAGVAMAAADPGVPHEHYSPPQVPFLDDYAEALGLSRLDSRPLLVYLAGRAFDRADERHFGDAEVQAWMRELNLVYLRRSSDEELFRRFRASRANPTFVVVNDREELISRWEGWMPPSTFRAYLEQAIDRHDRYLAGLDWDAATAYSPPDDALDAPVDDRMQGLAIADGKLWVLHARPRPMLYGLDPFHGEILDRIPLELASMRAMTGEGNDLYLLSYGWTRGDPVFRFDVRERRVVESIVTPSDRREHSAFGIAIDGDRLHVLHSRRVISTVDRFSGEELRRIEVHGGGYRVQTLVGLAHDGRDLFGTCRLKDRSRSDGRYDLRAETIHALARIDLDTGELLEVIEIGFPGARMEWDGGVFLVADEPEFGRDRNHDLQRTYPDRVRIRRVLPQR